MNIETYPNLTNEIKLFFNHYLNRQPNDDDVHYFLKLLKQGDLHITDVPKLITSSEEYQFFKKHEKQILQFKKYNETILNKELDKQKNQNKQNAISLVDIFKIAYSSNPLFTERFIEYFWTLKNLSTEGKILDIGCTESFLANELFKIKTLEVYGIDIRNVDSSTLFYFSQESAVKTHFENNFFDQITIVSSIEHFGLQVYGNAQIDEKADTKAMKEIKRILKKDGTLYLTTPYGINNGSFYRKYNKETLKKLFDGYKILEIKYFYQSDVGWKETDEKHASTIGHAKFYFGSEPFPGAIVTVKAIPL